MFPSLAAGVLLQAVSWKSAANFMHLCMKQRPETRGFSKTLFGFLSQLQILIIRSERELTSYSDKGFWFATMLSFCSGCFEFLI